MTLILAEYEKLRWHNSEILGSICHDKRHCQMVCRAGSLSYEGFSTHVDTRCQELFTDVTHSRSKRMFRWKYIELHRDELFLVTH